MGEMLIRRREQQGRPMTFVSFAQNFEDVMLWRALKHVRHGFYIDVGAFDPDFDSVTHAFYAAGWSGINIEPTRLGHDRLARHRPRDINLDVAIGEAEGVADFYDILETGLSTLDAEQARLHGQAGFAMRREEVRVTTLAAVCQLHAPQSIHFLKLDCEGSERAALSGADFTRHRPWIVVVEATRPNTQEVSHQEWEPLLLDAGYSFVWFDGLNRFYVAAEHLAALAPSFTAPPNVFDGFVRHDQLAALQPRRVDRGLLEASTPGMVDVEARIAITARCRDADPIPKVADAGHVRAAPDGSLVQVMHNGIQVPAGAYHGDWMTRLITLCKGHHEPQEERLFHEVVAHLPASAAMIELGGHWAYYTGWFLKDAPQRRAVVLEPDPLHRAAGERTLALNGLQAAFVAGFSGATPAEAVAFQTEDSGTVLLPCVTVPDLMRQHGMETLDILHCDTQGAELDVLASCRTLLAQGRIRWLFVSTHAHQITGDPLTHQRCLALLRDLGAEIEAEHDVHESFSGDGLIVARFGDAPEGWARVALSRNRYSESLFRNPAYDLAEALADDPDARTMAHIAESAHRALLLRSADGPGLQVHTDALTLNGNVHHYLLSILDSDEFAGKLDSFLAAYGRGASITPPAGEHGRDIAASSSAEPAALEPHGEPDLPEEGMVPPSGPAPDLAAGQHVAGEDASPLASGR